MAGNPYAAYDPTLLTQGITQGITQGMSALMQGFMKKKEDNDRTLKEGKVAKGFLELYGGDSMKEFLKKDASESDLQYSKRVSEQAGSLMQNLTAQRQKNAADMEAMQVQQAKDEQTRRADLLNQFKQVQPLLEGGAKGTPSPALMKQMEYWKSPAGQYTADVIRGTGQAPSEGSLGNFLTTQSSVNRRGAAPEAKVLDLGDRMAGVDPSTGKELWSSAKGKSPSTPLDPRQQAAIIERDKSAQTRIDSAKTEAADARVSVPQLEKTLGDLRAGKIYTGTGAEAFNSVKKAFQGLGFNVEGVSEFEQLKSATIGAMLNSIKATKGSTSDYESKMYQSANFNPSNSKEGNIALIENYIRVKKDIIEHEKYITSLEKKGMLPADIDAASSEWWQKRADAIKPPLSDGDKEKYKQAMSDPNLSAERKQKIKNDFIQWFGKEALKQVE